MSARAGKEIRKMTDKSHKKSKYQKPPSLHPLTPEQALAAALRVDPKDVAKLEAKEKAKKANGGKKK